MARALVIEGGGMKAIFANGVLSAFEEMGYQPWDYVVGTSAGGALGAWYSAGQARYAEETWHYVADKRILSLKKPLRGRPIFDHDALLHIVYEDEHPIDLEAIRGASWPVVVTAVDVETATCEYVDIRDKDIMAWLKATGRLPLGSGPPVSIEGTQYLDGGVVDPIPIQHTVSAGFDDVTLISNNIPGPKKHDPKPLVELAARKYPALRSGLEEHQALKHQAYAYAANPPEGVTVRVIRPESPLGLGRFTKDWNRLAPVLEQGRDVGRAFVTAIES